MNDPLMAEMVKGVAGVAWGEAESNDKRVARKYGVSRRTASRYRHEGPPWLRQAIHHVLTARNPWRLVSVLVTTVKEHTLAGMPKPLLLARYLELRVADARAECEDEVMEMEQGHGWLERAHAAEVASALLAEKAACCREFYRRGVREDEVYG